MSGYWANRAALAQFVIPGRNGPGDYIVWFNWHGYYDCVDVNLLPGDVMKGDKPVEFRYGKLPDQPNPTVTKIHHCEFAAVYEVAKGAHTFKMGTTNDASQCLDECITLNKNWDSVSDLDGGCTAVQAVRAQTTAPSLPNQPNIPWVNGHYDYIVEAGCYAQAVQQRYDPDCRLGAVQGPFTSVVQPNCNQSALLPFAEDQYVCYGLRPSHGLSAQVGEDWVVATEPEDAAWYSTCFVIDQFGDGGFIGIPAASGVPPVPNWAAAGDECIPCEFLQQVAALNFTQVPNWAAALRGGQAGVLGSSAALDGGCGDCDVYLSSADALSLRTQLAGSNNAETASDSSPVGQFAARSTTPENATAHSSLSPLASAKGQTRVARGGKRQHTIAWPQHTATCALRTSG